MIEALRGFIVLCQIRQGRSNEVLAWLKEESPAARALVSRMFKRTGNFQCHYYVGHEHHVRTYDEEALRHWVEAAERALAALHAAPYKRR